MKLTLSARESEIMNLRIGRGSASQLDEQLLLEEIISGRYDLVKITVPSTLPDLYQRLGKLGIPYCIVGIILHYRYDCVHHEVKAYYHDNLVFEPYDASVHREMLQQFARDIFRESPGSYFINPLLASVVTHEMYLKSFEEYVLSFDQQTDPHKLTYLVKHEGRWVGFLSLTNQNRESDAAYAGVIPDRRGTGYYLDMIRFIHNWGHEVGLKWGHGYVQLQNAVVQRFYHRTDMMVHDNHLSIHINPFLHRNAATSVTHQDVRVEDWQREVISRFQNLFPKRKLKQLNFSGTMHHLQGNRCDVSMRVALDVPQQAFSVAELKEPNGKTLQLAFAEFSGE
jgi:hypothetical protein